MTTDNYNNLIYDKDIKNISPRKQSIFSKWCLEKVHMKKKASSIIGVGKVCMSWAPFIQELRQIIGKQDLRKGKYFYTAKGTI